MPGHKIRIPDDMLPFAERLTVDQKKKWISDWRHLVWHSPRYIALYAAVIVCACGFFAIFLPAWQIADAIWIKILFGVGELFVAYILAEFAAYGFSKSTIEERIADFLKTEPNQALQHNDPSCHESCLRTPRASRGRG